MVRVCDRDVAAFEAIYDSYQWLVYSVALKMLGDLIAAEDVAQTVFLKLWDRPDAFRGGNFCGWLARLTRNCSIDVLRRRAARPEGEMPRDVAMDFNLEVDVLAKLEFERVQVAFEL